MAQPDLFANAPEIVEGLRHQADLVTEREAEALVEALRRLNFVPFDFHGHQANRQVVSFGWRYDYAARAVQPAAPIPHFLMSLRDKVADFAGCAAADFQQVLINLYEPGAGIGWHRDKPQFGLVAGVSLVSSCTLRFRRKDGAKWLRRAIALAPRSVYLMSGPTRWDWEHSISPVTERRYSITFRTPRGEIGP